MTWCSGLYRPGPTTSTPGCPSVPHRDSQYCDDAPRHFLLKWKCTNCWLERPLEKSILIWTGNICLCTQAARGDLTAKFNIKGWASERGGEWMERAGRVKEGKLQERRLWAGCGYICVTVVLMWSRHRGRWGKDRKSPPLLISGGPQGAKDPEARKRTEGNDSEAVSE